MFCRYVGWSFVAFGVFMVPLTITEPECLRVLQNIGNFVLGTFMILDSKKGNPC